MLQHPLPGMGIAASFVACRAVPMPSCEPLCEEAARGIGNVIGGAVGAVGDAVGGIWSAVSSGFNNSATGAAVGNVAQNGVSSGWAQVLGRAVVGAVLSAGSAYLMGVRGQGLWVAGLGGGAVAGIGAWGQQQAQLGATDTTPQGAPIGGGSGPIPLSDPTAHMPTTPAPTNAGGGIMSNLMGQISSVFSANGQSVGGLDMNRVLALVTSAALGGQSMGQLDKVVAARKAELDALNAKDHNVYLQQLAVAQDILNKAYAMDPKWLGRMAMADVAGMGERELEGLQRNLAVAQGGYNQGAANATDRKGKIDIAAKKAIAYNRASIDGEGKQAQLMAQAAGLMGPDEGAYDKWKAGTELDLTQAQSHGAYNADRARILNYALTGNNGPYTDPGGLRTDTNDGRYDPNAPRDPNDQSMNYPYPTG